MVGLGGAEWQRPGAPDGSASVEIRPVSAADVPGMAAVIGGSGGSGCWCQRFTGCSGPVKRPAFEREVERSDQPIGLIALRDDRCVGWSRVVLRRSLPGITANRGLSKLYIDDDVSLAAAWWISCVAVSRSARGQGIGVALLREAVDYARAH